MKRLKNLKISTKIIVSFIFFSFLMLGAGITGIYNTSNVSNTTGIIHEQPVKEALGYMIFISILAMAGVVASIFLARSVTAPIKKLSYFMKTNLVENGDLTASFNTSTNDEIGVLAGDLNSFVENIHDYVARVTGTWQSLSGGVENVVGNNSRLSGNISRENETIRKITADLRKLRLRSYLLDPEIRKEIDRLYNTFSMLTAITAETEELVATTGEQARRIQEDTQRILEMVTQDEPSGAAHNDIVEAAAAGQVEFSNSEFAEDTGIDQLHARVEPEGNIVH